MPGRAELEDEVFADVLAEETDGLIDFFEVNYIVALDGERTDYKPLYNHYKSYCEANNIQPEYARTFHKNFTKILMAKTRIHSARLKGSSGSTRYYKYVKRRSNEGTFERERS